MRCFALANRSEIGVFEAVLSDSASNNSLNLTSISQTPNFQTVKDLGKAIDEQSQAKKKVINKHFSIDL